MADHVATVIMDAAIDGATAMVAAAWQIASGNDGARTPEYVNALNADPALRARLDNALRPYVERVAHNLREAHGEDWDDKSNSRYYARFGREMHGFSAQEWAPFEKEQGK